MSVDIAACAHERTDTVETSDLTETTIVGLVCVDCLAALPVNWGCPDCEWVEERTMRGDRWRGVSWPCDQHRDAATA